MKTFRQELIDYQDRLNRLNWLQCKVDKLKVELANTAEIICTHTDAIRGESLLVTPKADEIKNGAVAFTVFILQPSDWSLQSATQNLKLQTLIEIKQSDSSDPGFVPGCDRAATL